jgi:hypothetical protein
MTKAESCAKYYRRKRAKFIARFADVDEWLKRLWRRK